MKTSVIIPSRSLKRDKNPRYFYKSVFSLPDLIESLKKQSEADFEVVVVVNGLTDTALLEYVRGEARIDRFTVVSENVGVSRAWNIGRQLARGENVVFLNDDVALGEAALKEFISALENCDHAGIVAPKGSFWIKGQHSSYYEGNQTQEVDCVVGFAFALRTAVFDVLGGVDVAYTPAGYEEIDLCFAARKAGFRNYAVPAIAAKTEIMHGISARNEEIEYMSEKINTKDLNQRNREYFQAKWGKSA